MKGGKPVAAAGKSSPQPSDPAPLQVDIQGGLVIHLGSQAASVIAATEKLQQKLGKEKLKLSTVQIAGQPWHRVELDGQFVYFWGHKGEYFILGTGEDVVAGILARMDKQPPGWLTTLHKQLPVGRPATCFYLNVKSLLDSSFSLAGAKKKDAKAIVEAIGLDNVTSLVGVSGLDDRAFVTRVLLATDGPSRGLLRGLRPFAGAQRPGGHSCRRHRRPCGSVQRPGSRGWIPRLCQESQPGIGRWVDPFHRRLGTPDGR